MNSRERAEAIKDVAARDWRDKKQPVIEKTRGQNRLEFYREPDFIYGKDGQVIGVDAWVRLYGPDGKELRVDPHRRIVNPPTVPRSGVQEVDTGRKDDRGLPIKDRILTPDPLAAFYEAVWDSVEGAPNAKGWRTRGTVTTVFSDASDGQISSTSPTYATARTGASLSANTSGTTMSVGQSLVGDYQCFEAFISFDTSAIADSDQISLIVLDLYLLNDTSATDFTVEAREYNWGATLTTADWVAGASLGGLILMASINTSGIGGAGAYKAFTSDPAFLVATGLKTGVVHLMLCSSRLRLGNAPSGAEDVSFRTAEQSGTTQDPKLTLTHQASTAIPMFTSRPNRIWRLR
ncbi:hypothetical protein AB0I81_34775 [Nonomuraea sp. NPDC050404]|uniref:hypothetical protein n=1 Tax=Nonomuraea sp. NPDC050404 TaxID=3155783 RepID=UPI0033C79866